MEQLSEMLPNGLSEFSNQLERIAQSKGIQTIPLWNHPSCQLTSKHISSDSELCFIPIQTPLFGCTNVTIGNLYGGFDIYAIGSSILSPIMLPNRSIPFRYGCRLHFSINEDRGKLWLTVSEVGGMCINILDNQQKMHGYHLMQAVVSIADVIGIDSTLLDTSSASFTSLLIKQISYYEQFGFHPTSFNVKENIMDFFNSSCDKWILNYDADSFEQQANIQQKYQMNQFPYKQHSVAHLLLSHGLVDKLRHCLREIHFLKLDIGYCFKEIGYPLKRSIQNKGNMGHMEREALHITHQI